LKQKQQICGIFVAFLSLENFKTGLIRYVHIPEIPRIKDLFHRYLKPTSIFTKSLELNISNSICYYLMVHFSIDFQSVRELKTKTNVSIPKQSDRLIELNFVKLVNFL